jgi:hypothetical protein
VELEDFHRTALNCSKSDSSVSEYKIKSSTITRIGGPMDRTIDPCERQVGSMALRMETIIAED